VELRYRHLVLLFAIGLLLASPSAFAQQPASPILRFGALPLRPTSSPFASSVVCQAGMNGSPAAVTSISQGASYYTLLAADSCMCGSDAVELSSAHLGLIFGSPCMVDISVSIVGSILDAPGCYRPNPGNVIFPAVSRSVGAPSSGIHDIVVPLPDDWCITEPAFLCITFDSFGTCVTPVSPPGLVDVASCTSCATWLSFDSRDWCAFHGGAVGNPIMYADADCCQLTPIHRESWGRLKTLYR
jgi:hypothetical protein